MGSPQRYELHEEASLGLRLTKASASQSTPEHPQSQDQMCDKLTAMALQPRSLLDLPAEVRLIIYKNLFAWPEHIKLRLLESGYIRPVEAVKLNLRSLRTCKTFYTEACPVLYGINTFSVAFHETKDLGRMRQASRLCIENLAVEAPANMSDDDISVDDMVHIQNEVREVLKYRTEKLNLGMVGATLPGIQRLTVNPSTSSAFLSTILQLSMSLPCSPIREDWPVLEVIVELPVLSELTPPQNTRLALSEEHATMLKHNRQLSALDGDSTLGLGHEMPDYKLIQIR